MQYMLFTGEIWLPAEPVQIGSLSTSSHFLGHSNSSIIIPPFAHVGGTVNFTSFLTNNKSNLPNVSAAQLQQEVEAMSPLFSSMQQQIVLQQTLSEEQTVSDEQVEACIRSHASSQGGYIMWLTGDLSKLQPKGIFV